MAKNVVYSSKMCSSRRTQNLEFISNMISFCGLRLEGYPFLQKLIHPQATATTATE